MKWSVVYEKAIRDDGSLFFPERLNQDFLDNARRTMGVYLFANQYLNQVIPDEAKNFKMEWIRFYSTLPSNTYRFAFIDPAIGQKSHHDYTGIAVVEVDDTGQWYLTHASRHRLTPTQIVDKIFDLHKRFPCQAIGIEQVAYQEALLYMVDQEMKRRNELIPLKGITRGASSKNVRILGLVPRFEWGRILVSQGLVDFEDEFSTFPRGSHDDILDAVASLEELVFYPNKIKETNYATRDPNHPQYEAEYIRRLASRPAGDERGEGDASNVWGENN